MICPAENCSHLHIAIELAVISSEQRLNRVRGESEAMRFQLFVTISLLLSVLAAGELQGQVNDSSSANHVFAQFADGRFSDESFYRSTLMVSSDNLNATNCTATLHGLTVAGFGDGIRRLFTVNSGGWNIYQSPGSQTFRGGYLTLNCSLPVTAQILYSFFSSSGIVISEATVFSSPPATYAQLLADQRGAAQLGIAIANAGNTTKEFLVVAIDATDTEIGRRSVQIAGRSQTASFLNELISLPADYVGQVMIYTNSGDTLDVYAIGLRFTGSAFTTIPVTVRTPR